jgi:hypothetical protein
MSSMRFTSQSTKPRRFSTHRVVAVVAILFFVAYYAAVFLFWRLPALPEQPPSQPSSNALALNPVANEQVLPTEERTSSSPEAAAPRVTRGEVAGALDPPIAPSPALSPAANRPISVIVTAPTEVADGNTFEVSVAVPGGSGVHSAHFKLSYDQDALEMLDTIDATGTTVSAVPSEPAASNSISTQEQHKRLRSGSLRGQARRAL